MYALGIDIGSSSVKTAILTAEQGEVVFTTQYPDVEMPIASPQKSWAEQDPDMWWNAFLKCLENIRAFDETLLAEVKYIGITYQMHGLVIVDRDHKVLRPSIIWCDSRAVEVGETAFTALGSKFCLHHYLNSPGNFTASKLKWVKENEPDIFEKIHRAMLPGDYIAMKLSGVINTSITGLSEGVFWDFEEKQLAKTLLDHLGIDKGIIPDFKESLSIHSKMNVNVAQQLGINASAVISYKAGDQPNNALSLNVLNPGEIAATAGTSGVVYGVVDSLFVDEAQRVNSFAHVNYSEDKQRIGVLLCINGVGISNAWVKRNFNFASYTEMNKAANEVSPGSEGLLFFPFGNGAERMLGNKEIDASIEGLNYNIHHKGHFARSVQEGIAFAFAYGMEAFADKGIKISRIKAGHANMFLSNLFTQTLADLTGVDIELYDTDGSVGAGRGALIGGDKLAEDKAFEKLKLIKVFSGNAESPYPVLYKVWKSQLEKKLKS